MIDPVAATAATALAGPVASKAVSQAEFLQLFVAQLQHQDPLSPLEPNELTAQLAQFSSLEQLTAINTRLDGLAGSARQANSAAVLGLIGKEIAFDGSQLALADGRAPEVAYTLGQGAEKVTATVRDASGKIVRVVELGGQAAGPQTFRFDGKSDAGTALPDGTYQLEVAALAKGAKAPAPVDLTTRATVDGVDLTGDSPVLLAGSLRIGLEQVRAVHSAGTGP
jgi:flagellar basal-body rod modification protein FlgD